MYIYIYSEEEQERKNREGFPWIGGGDITMRSDDVGRGVDVVGWLDERKREWGCVVMLMRKYIIFDEKGKEREDREE